MDGCLGRQGDPSVFLPERPQHPEATETGEQISRPQSVFIRKEKSITFHIRPGSNKTCFLLLSVQLA